MDFQPMSPDDMQRAMQFLLNQQAQFAADLSQHREQSAADLSRHREQFAADLEQLSATVEQLSATVERLSATVERLSATVERLSEKTDRIADGLIGLTGLVGRAIDALTAAQVRADERFERHLREDHGPPPPS